jgi:hypothetical protein
MTANEQLLLVRVPDGQLTPDCFATRHGEVADPGRGELVIRNLLLSIDPAARAWLSQRTYRDQLRPGDVMAGYTLGEVVAENGSGHAIGSLVFADGGWQEYAVLPGSAARTVAPRAELPVELGLLGITGLTAYFGLLRIGRPQPGATVVVSAAAGATGNVVGQLARARECRVIGIAGSAEKGRVLVDELGFDAFVNHRSPTLRDDLRAAAPDGIDIYFDNVGGLVLATVLPMMRTFGRVVCCGAVSEYDTGAGGMAARAIPGLLVTRRLLMQGFLVHDFEDEWADAHDVLAAEYAAGRLVSVHEVLDGLGSAPDALVGLLHGENVGKRMVRIAEMR